MAVKLKADRVGWDVAGRAILGKIDFELGAKECLAVVGPNGAGKTTLLKIVAGLLVPSRGECLWETTTYDQISRKDLARRISYVPQSRPLRVPLTVEHLVLLGRYPYLSAFRLAPTKTDYQVVAESLELAGMQALRGRKLETLSGGERQSAYIAAALAQQAEVLILDEPTAYLDPRHQRDVAALLLRLKRERGLTILIATHDLNFASLIADRILALRSGGVVACETPADLLQPERLAEVFDAPFTVVRPGSRPLTMLEIDS